MKKTFIALFSALAMVLIGCSQPTGGDIPDWENPPSEIGGGDSTDPAEPENPVTDPESDPVKPEDPVTKFTVTFKTAHGKNPASIEVEKDTVLTAEQLKELTFEGFDFKGWFDGETQVVVGKYKVTKDVTLTAKWEKSSSTDPDPVDPEPEKSPYEELLKDIENAKWSFVGPENAIPNTLDYDATDLFKESGYEDFTVDIFIEKCLEAKRNGKFQEPGEYIEFAYNAVTVCCGEAYLVYLKAPGEGTLIISPAGIFVNGNIVTNSTILEIYKKKVTKS